LLVSNSGKIQLFVIADYYCAILPCKSDQTTDQKSDQTTMILAGDVGGTKSNLGLFVQEGSTLRMVFQRRLATRDHAGFEALIEEFLAQARAADAISNRAPIEAAGFGVAGVVVAGKHYSENLRWVLDGSMLERKLNLNPKNVRLVNDLAATALSLERLPADDFVVLNQGTPVLHGARGVIAAGTGLGEALLFWNGKKYEVAPAEGGMADFAPHTERETQLLSYLRRQFPQISNEEVVSGRGFRRIHEFLDSAVRHASFDSPEGNAAGEITKLALENSCKVCVETLGFWVEIFGAVTGNFALQTMSLSGVYVAGGIAAKLLSRLQDGIFFKAFCGAGKLAPVLQRIPILVVVNEDAPIWGAAYEALASVSLQ
jgi:glucokinase